VGTNYCNNDMKYYTSTTEFNCGIDLHAHQIKANTVLAIKLARAARFMLLSLGASAPATSPP
jgi:hypothetical protein